MNEKPKGFESAQPAAVELLRYVDSLTAFSPEMIALSDAICLRIAEIQDNPLDARSAPDGKLFAIEMKLAKNEILRRIDDRRVVMRGYVAGFERAKEVIDEALKEVTDSRDKARGRFDRLVTAFDPFGQITGPGSNYDVEYGAQLKLLKDLKKIIFAISEANS